MARKSGKVSRLQWIEEIDAFLNRHPGWFFALLGLLALGGIGLMLAVTPHGIGLVNDSVGYVAGARNLLAGNGYSRLTGDGSPVPITNFPPMFSFVLAGIGLTGLDGTPAAHGLNVILMGVNVFLIGLAVRRATRSQVLALLGGLIFLISDPVIRSHSFAMTEPLYLTVVFGMLFCLDASLRTRKWGWLAASGFVASLAFLTRYVGISLYALGVAALLVLHPEPQAGRMLWSRRIRDLLIFLAAGVPLVAVWLGRNYFASSNLGNRQLIYHAIPAEKVRFGLLNFWGWLLPESGGFVEKLLPFWGGLLAVILLGLAAGAVLAGLRELRRMPSGLDEGTGRFTWLFALQALSYLAVLLLSMMFLDASPIFEDRTLVLVQTPLIVLGMAALRWLWQRRLNWMRWAVALLTILLLLFLTEDSLDAMRELRWDGQGFAHSAIQESRLIAAAQDLPDEMLLYSNRVTALYIVVGLPAYVLPSPMNPATNLPREGYEQDLANIHQRVLEGKAAMVIFNYRGLQADPEDADWMEDLTVGMPLLGEYDDGAIFGVLGKN
jgi:4-amino-4-deoxy-L-arabinose transferase-like glycosyltransferase